MQIRTTETAEGRTVTITTGRRFDVSSHYLFCQACSMATDPTTTNIVVDLSKTRHLHDFGLALLIMLYQHAARLKNGISLVNCSPKIRGKLLDATLHLH